MRMKFLAKTFSNFSYIKNACAAGAKKLARCDVSCTFVNINQCAFFSTSSRDGKKDGRENKDVLGAKQTKLGRNFQRRAARAGAGKNRNSKFASPLTDGRLAATIAKPSTIDLSSNMLSAEARIGRANPAEGKPQSTPVNKLVRSDVIKKNQLDKVLDELMKKYVRTKTPESSVKKGNDAISKNHIAALKPEARFVADASALIKKTKVTTTTKEKTDLANKTRANKHKKIVADSNLLSAREPLGIPSEVLGGLTGRPAGEVKGNENKDVSSSATEAASVKNDLMAQIYSVAKKFNFKDSSEVKLFLRHLTRYKRFNIKTNWKKNRDQQRMMKPVIPKGVFTPNKIGPDKLDYNTTTRRNQSQNISGENAKKPHGDTVLNRNMKIKNDERQKQGGAKKSFSRTQSQQTPNRAAAYKNIARPQQQYSKNSEKKSAQLNKSTSTQPSTPPVTSAKKRRMRRVRLKQKIKAGLVIPRDKKTSSPAVASGKIGAAGPAEISNSSAADSTKVSKPGQAPRRKSRKSEKYLKYQNKLRNTFNRPSTAESRAADTKREAIKLYKATSAAGPTMDANDLMWYRRIRDALDKEESEAVHFFPYVGDGKQETFGDYLFRRREFNRSEIKEARLKADYAFWCVFYSRLSRNNTIRDLRLAHTTALENKPGWFSVLNFEKGKLSRAPRPGSAFDIIAVRNEIFFKRGRPPYLKGPSLMKYQDYLKLENVAPLVARYNKTKKGATPGQLYKAYKENLTPVSRYFWLPELDTAGKWANPRYAPGKPYLSSLDITPQKIKMNHWNDPVHRYRKTWNNDKKRFTFHRVYRRTFLGRLANVEYTIHKELYYHRQTIWRKLNLTPIVHFNKKAHYAPENLREALWGTQESFILSYSRWLILWNDIGTVIKKSRLNPGIDPSVRDFVFGMVSLLEYIKKYLDEEFESFKHDIEVVRAITINEDVDFTRKLTEVVAEYRRFRLLCRIRKLVKDEFEYDILTELFEHFKNSRPAAGVQSPKPGKNGWTAAFKKESGGGFVAKKQGFFELWEMGEKYSSYADRYSSANSTPDNVSNSHFRSAFERHVISSLPDSLLAGWKSYEAAQKLQSYRWHNLQKGAMSKVFGFLDLKKPARDKIMTAPEADLKPFPVNTRSRVFTDKMLETAHDIRFLKEMARKGSVGCKAILRRYYEVLHDPRYIGQPLRARFEAEYSLRYGPGLTPYKLLTEWPDRDLSYDRNSEAFSRVDYFENRRKNEHVRRTWDWEVAPQAEDSKNEVWREHANTAFWSGYFDKVRTWHALNKNRWLKGLYVVDEKPIPFYGSLLPNSYEAVQNARDAAAEIEAAEDFVRWAMTRSGFAYFNRMNFDPQTLAHLYKTFVRIRKTGIDPFAEQFRDPLKRLAFMKEARLSLEAEGKDVVSKKKKSRSRLKKDSSEMPAGAAAAPLEKSRRSARRPRQKKNLPSGELYHLQLLEGHLQSARTEARAEKKDIDRIKSPLQKFSRYTSIARRANEDLDTDYVLEFINNKKNINKINIRDRHFPDIKMFDLVPQKYFFYHMQVDPLHRSFLINKLINVFGRGGNKKKIRNVFYSLFDSEKEYLSPDTFYYIITSLRPDYLNVIARRGRIIYRAPIPASETKSIMKAIRFFKRAVMSRRYETSLAAKIEGEVLDYMYWLGYRNEFYEEYTDISAANRFMKHFRSKKIY